MRKIIAEQSDIALIYLDVVMETDDAGLKVVEFIRDEMKIPSSGSFFEPATWFCAERGNCQLRHQ